MKTKITSVLTSAIIILFLSACVSNETANSDSVKQSEIYQSYSITYDASDMELSATAFFRFGGSAGTTLNLVKPSTVTLNSVEMAMGKNILAGTFYESDQQTELTKTYSFVFTDTESKTYTNSASIEPLVISEYPVTISKKDGFSVSWTGNPIQNGERVYLTLEGTDMSSCSASTDMVGATSIDIKPELLKDMKPGNANIILKREISNSLKEATHLGGTISITYVSKKVATKIE